jgi:hypothetical protein
MKHWPLAVLAAVGLVFVGCSGLPALPVEEEPIESDQQPEPVEPLAPLTTGEGEDLVTACQDSLSGYVPVVENVPYQTPPMDEPAPHEPFIDPTFGTCVVRVTDRDTDISPDDDSAGLKNEYSRVQSFNADETLVLVRGIESTWYLYDASTLQLIKELEIGGWIDPRWDATDPNILYYTPETSLMAYDVLTDGTWVIHDFLEEVGHYNPVAVWDRGEGSPSADGRYWAFMVEDQDWWTIALLTYDQVEDRVIATLELPRQENEPDSVTISPLGDFVFAQFEPCEVGLGSYELPCGAMVYTRDLTDGWGLVRNSGHGDLALDRDGNEVFVFQDNDTDYLSMVPVAGGAVELLWPIDFSHTPLSFHISGRAFNRPGWVLISVVDGDAEAHTWMDDHLFAMELRPNGQIVHLAHHHSIVNEEEEEHDYWAEPHGTVNRDFTRALFTTNWGRSGTGEVEMFMIVLPPDWPSR